MNLMFCRRARNVTISIWLSLDRASNNFTAASLYHRRVLQSSAFLFRSDAQLKTELFATSSRSPKTFGQLLSSTSYPNIMTTPSCPCCAFIKGGLFLPFTEDDYTNQESSVARKEVVAEAVDVMTPADALKMISKETRKVTLVDTHGHPHLRRNIEYADVSCQNMPEGEDGRVVSLTCAVSPLDWNDTLQFASQSQFILPALGIHPWYLNDILADTNNQQEEVEKYLSWDWLEELEQHIKQHPNLVVGEIGLCKMARFVREFPVEHGGKQTALQLQKIVFRKQMELAAKYRRPVTVHCVNMHGSFMEVLAEILHDAKESYNTRESETYDNSISLQEFVRGKFPPSIAMHSFTGTAHHAQEILIFEDEILNPHKKDNAKRGSKKRMQSHADAADKQSSSNTKHCLFYFGFSHAVNQLMCTSDKARRKGMEAVRAIPPERLLAESDVHNSADVILGTAGAVAYIAAARGEELTSVADQTTMNGLRYLSSLST
jgi:Tat protein secretion system quality control protein TatD with DNase activity